MLTQQELARKTGAPAAAFASVLGENTAATTEPELLRCHHGLWSWEGTCFQMQQGSSTPGTIKFSFVNFPCVTPDSA